MTRCCSLDEIDREIPDRIRREVEAQGGLEEICRVLAERDLAALAAVAKVLGSEKRLTILHALARQRMCVCMLAELTDCTYSKCSYHIARLRDAELVEAEHLGSAVVYSLTPHGRETLRQLDRIEEVEE